MEILTLVAVREHRARCLKHLTSARLAIDRDTRILVDTISSIISGNKSEAIAEARPLPDTPALRENFIQAKSMRSQFLGGHFAYDLSRCQMVSDNIMSISTHTPAQKVLIMPPGLVFCNGQRR